MDIYDIHGYFRELTVGQQTPGFWDKKKRKKEDKLKKANCLT